MRIDRYLVRSTAVLTGSIFLFLSSPIVAAPPTIGANKNPAAPSGWSTERSGNDLLFTPPDIPTGEIFTMTVKPDTSLGSDSFRSWFEAQMEADGARIGTLIKDGVISEQSKVGMLTTVRGFRTAAGEPRIAAFMAIRRPGGLVRFTRVLSSPKKEIYNRYFRDTIQVALSMATRSDTGTSTVASSSKAPSTEKSKRPPSRSEIMRQQYTVRPGAGVKPSQIEGIYNHTTTQIGVGGYVYVVYEPILVLKDGTYYDDFDLPPSDLNIEASRRLRPKDWGRWRRAGKGFQTLDKKGWSDANWLGPLSGAAPGSHLNGYYSHLGGGGNTAYGGTMTFASVSSFTFHPDGHFEGGSNTSVSSQESNVGIAGGSSRKTDGTYRLDGYSIEFHYNDGHIDRRSFVFMDVNKKDAFYLNGSPYLPK